jgi:hypothetical protein
MRDKIKKIQEKRRMRKVRRQAEPYLGYTTWSDSLERDIFRNLRF